MSGLFHVYRTNFPYTTRLWHLKRFFLIFYFSKTFVCSIIHLQEKTRWHTVLFMRSAELTESGCLRLRKVLFEPQIFSFFTIASSRRIEYNRELASLWPFITRSNSQKTISVATQTVLCYIILKKTT